MTALRRKRNRRTRREMREYEERGGTPETVSKLEADPLRELIDARDENGNKLNLVDSAMERAAHEISVVYNAIVRALMSKRQAFMALPGSVQEIPDYVARAHAERYIPWAADVGPEAVDETITLIVDRQPVRHWDRAVFALRNYSRRMG